MNRLSLMQKVLKLRMLLKEPFPDQGLTQRQAAVARLAAMGMTNEEVAEKVGLTPGTVGSMLAVVKRKTGFSKSGLTRHLFEKIEEILNGKAK